MKICMILLAAVTLAHGQDTSEYVTLVANTNFIDWGAVAYSNSVVFSVWDYSTRLTFGDGITLDTKTGEVEFPASVTNMTEAAKQFWCAVCDVSGAEPPEWLGRPVMEETLTLHTNVFHPKQYKTITCYPTMPPQYVETWGDHDTGMNESMDNPDVRITVVTEKRELLVRFEGREHRILLGEREASRMREERKVEEVWIKKENE